MLKSDFERIEFQDRKDWLEAWLCLAILFAAAVAFFALVREPPGDLPPYLRVPVMLIVLLPVFLLAKTILAARTRRVSFDPETGVLEVVTWRPGQRERSAVHAGEVERLEFLTTDNDGLWHTARLVLRDGRSFGFAQGESRALVRERHDRLAAALRQANPDIRLVESAG